MTTTTKMTASALRTRISELEATPRALVGSDSGTHGKPSERNIYEEITGERYATYSFAGANATRCSVESAYDDTDGRIREFRGAQAKIRELARELKEAKRRLAAIERK